MKCLGAERSTLREHLYIPDLGAIIAILIQQGRPELAKMLVQDGDQFSKVVVKSHFTFNPTYFILAATSRPLNRYMVEFQLLLRSSHHKGLFRPPKRYGHEPRSAIFLDLDINALKRHSREMLQGSCLTLA